jgi:hypothetical protein
MTHTLYESFINSSETLRIPLDKSFRIDVFKQQRFKQETSIYGWFHYPFRILSLIEKWLVGMKARQFACGSNSRRNPRMAAVVSARPD